MHLKQNKTKKIKTMASNDFQFCLGLILSVAICFGIVGNIISYIIWTKGTRCKKTQSRIYLRALSISDTIALCIPATHKAVDLIFNVKLKHQNTVLCKLAGTGRHFGLLVSSWIIVCFTVERTLSVFKPRRPTQGQTEHRTRAIVVIIFIVNFLLNLPYGILYDVLQTTGSRNKTQKAENSSETSPSEHNYTTVNYSNMSTRHKRACTADSISVFESKNWYHIWLMDFVLIFLIPFLLITVSNTVVLTMIAIRRERKLLQTTRGSRTFNVTMRAITVSIVHCITTAPNSLLALFPELQDTASKVKFSPEYYVYHSAIVFAYFNHAINFVLYSFFGTDFRRDCVEMFHRKQRAVHPEIKSGTMLQTSLVWSRSATNKGKDPDNARF